MDCSVDAQKLRGLGGREKDFTEITSKRLPGKSRQKSPFLEEMRKKKENRTNFAGHTIPKWHVTHIQIHGEIVKDG